jgi:hypothetical protein
MNDVSIQYLTDFFWLSLCKIVRSSVILLLPLFVLDQHAKLDMYSASTLKQQSESGFESRSEIKPKTIKLVFAVPS